MKIDLDGNTNMAAGAVGLLAYSWDGLNSVKIDEVDDGGFSGNARNLAIGPDGTIFVDNGEDGLQLYEVSTDSLLNTPTFVLEEMRKGWLFLPTIQFL